MLDYFKGWQGVGIIAFIIILLALAVYIFLPNSILPVPVTKTTISGTFNINGVIPRGATITLLERRAQSNDQFAPFAQNILPKDGASWQFSAPLSGQAYEIKAMVTINGQPTYTTSPIFSTTPAKNQTLVFDLTELVPLPAATAAISGSVNIDGYIPPGATLSLQERKNGTQAFTIVTQSIPAKDAQDISYSTAIAGQLYDVQAVVVDANKKIIGTSPILTVAAPASNEKLTINSTAIPPATPTLTPSPLAPVTTIATNTPAPSPSSIVVSGTITFEGQVPPDSRIVIFQRPTSTQNYQVAVDNIAPSDGVTWKWTGASNGQMYDIIAILKQKQSDGTDKDVSSSEVETVAAPAADVTLTINSGFSLSAPTGNITVACSNYDSNSATWTAAVSFDSVDGALSYWYQIGTTNGGIELTNFTKNAASTSAQTFTFQFQNNVRYYARYAYAAVANLQANDSQFSPFSSTTQLYCSQ